MKRLLIILMAAILLVACGKKEVEEKVLPEEDTSDIEVIEVESEESEEEVNGITNIDLDVFIESYNSIAIDAGNETFERNENEDIVADGLMISVNDDGTVQGIKQPTSAMPSVVIATLTAIKEQTNEEDAEKINVFLNAFGEALDQGGLYSEEITIESMTIKIMATGPTFIVFEVIGNEQS